MGFGEAHGALRVFSRPRHRVLLSQHFCTLDDPTLSGVLRGVDAVDGCVPGGAWGMGCGGAEPVSGTSLSTRLHVCVGAAL